MQLSAAIQFSYHDIYMIHNITIVFIDYLRVKYYVNVIFVK